MTDRPDLDPADPDELASALHDGEASAEERARAAEPAVQAEVAVVGAIAARVGDVPPAPPGLVDDHVAAALAAFDDRDAEVAEPTPVVDLAARRPWWQRSPLGAVAAAVAVVALVGAIGVAAVGDDGADTSTDTASATLEAADDAGAEDADRGGDGGEEAFEADAAEGSGGASAGATGLAGRERESFASYDELAAALDERVRSQSAPDATTAEASTTSAANAEGSVEGPSPAPERSAAGCDAIGAAGIDPGTVQLATGVVVAERLVTAVVHGEGDHRTLTVVDEETCAVVEQRPL